ncbi:hypothetical protein PHLGIDRAFT_36379 [Phlebiopsis gigantea 11061_1 CR5-6]|uniref:F-box domain-containing protein n=1 Tax=Phlebiopsis gigantea (strain 11061_1 CR5-6) TaxID=745531 RepID=A0A0C3RVV7_PHLG1|nr:hypothetical protein PHLGIDRAFT_36379 [Phlebiopsis gigantea 11061_1 CR5-6]
MSMSLGPIVHRCTPFAIPESSGFRRDSSPRYTTGPRTLSGTCLRPPSPFLWRIALRLRERSTVMDTAENADSTECATRQAPDCALTERERARQALQAEIDVHRQQIIRKMRRMNGLLTINCLPPELLAEIFRVWIDATKNLPYLSHRWIKIAHVCHLWREVALSSPRLWSDLTIGTIDWTREMLARSKQAPLSILLSSLYSHPWSPEAFRLVLGELSRIEKFEICGVDLIARQLVLCPSAPLLHSLIFTGLERPLYNPGNYTTRDRTVATAFEAVDLPKLSYLELKESHVSWSSPLFKPALTRLLFHESGTRYPDTDFAQVLRVLESMPLLQTLDLAGVLPILPDDESPLPVLDHYISLPALQTLAIAGRAKSCAFLLQHLKASVTSLYADCRNMNPADAKILAPAIAAKLRRPWSTNSTVPLRLMHFTDSYIVAWDEMYPLETLVRMYSLGLPEPKPRLKLFAPGIVVEAMLEVLAALPLAEMRLCVIGGERYDSYSRVWPKLFESIHHVAELAIYESSNHALVKTLQQPTPVSAGQRLGRRRKQKKTELLLPRLKVLSLNFVRFRDYVYETEENSLFASYKKMLKTRQTTRHQIEKLVIRNAINLNSGDCGSLKPMVKEVEWDKLEDWSDGDHDDDDDDEEDYSDEDDYDFPLEYDDVEIEDFWS